MGKKVRVSLPSFVSSSGLVLASSSSHVPFRKMGIHEFFFFYEGRSPFMRLGFIGRISRWICPSLANCRSVDFVSNQLEGISNRSLLEGAWSFASLVLWSISGSITSDEGEGGWPKIPSPSKNMELFLLQLKQTKHRKEASCKGWVPWLL